MSNELRDRSGLALPRNLVLRLARANMRASSEPDSAASLSDAALVQWATDSAGLYFGPQVEQYSDGEYSPCSVFRPDADDLPTCGECGFSKPGHDHIPERYR